MTVGDHGGYAPTSYILWGQLPPLPPPGSAAYALHAEVPFEPTVCMLHLHISREGASSSMKALRPLVLFRQRTGVQFVKLRMRTNNSPWTLNWRVSFFWTGLNYFHVVKVVLLLVVNMYILNTSRIAPKPSQDKENRVLCTGEQERESPTCGRNSWAKINEAERDRARRSTQTPDVWTLVSWTAGFLWYISGP